MAVRSTRPTIGRLGQRRQVVIPKRICERLGLQEGDFVEVRSTRNTVVIKPKKVVDPDDVLTPEEEAIVLKGMEQIRRGEYVTLEELRRALGRKPPGSPAKAGRAGSRE
ncbi:MAG: AbrB/MazE/SpoVT family DNA-binding domain-containing protein [Acidobacteriota bacterium]